MLADSVAVSMPVEQQEAAVEQHERNAQAAAAAAATTPATQPSDAAAQEGTSKQAVLSKKSGPTSPSTPSQRPRADTATSTTPTKSNTRTTQPAVPLVPAVPKQAPKSSSAEKPAPDAKQVTDDGAQAGEVPGSTGPTPDAPAPEATLVASPRPKAAPTSWAKLFAKSSAASQAGPNGASVDDAAVNGDGSTGTTGTVGAGSSFSTSNTNSVAEAVRAYRVGGGDKASFIEPRGLINTGNMCYMNSVRLSCLPLKTNIVLTPTDFASPDVLLAVLRFSEPGQQASCPQFQERDSAH